MRVLTMTNMAGGPLRAVLNGETGRIMFYDGRETGTDPQGTRHQAARTPDGQFVTEWLTGDFLSNPTLILDAGHPGRNLTPEGLDLVVKWLRCDVTARYSTARDNGMEFIGGRWVHAGDKGYRVKPDADGEGFNVYSYAHTADRIVYGGKGLSEDDAHDMAWRLAYGK